jgi:cystathionine gamma-lyase
MPGDDVPGTGSPRYGPGTRVVRAGQPHPRDEQPFLPGPTFAAPYHLRGEPSAHTDVYGREDNPTWRGLEAAIGELEGGRALVFASGMAAAAAVLLELSKPGCPVVVPSDGYPAVRALARDHLAHRGVPARVVPTNLEAILEALPGASLVWVETPSNPRLDVVEISVLARAARDAGALLVVDNTLATPLGSSPLALGADFVVASGSKHLSGHSDLLLGYVAARDPHQLHRLHEWRTLAGAIPGPFEAWLAHRSLATLELRFERQCANAGALAELLAAREEIPVVRYPGLEGDPSHTVARTQMRAFGSVLGFVLADRRQAERFLEGAELIVQATSFGGVHTTAERRARWGMDDIDEGWVRLSAGVENTADLVADLTRALERAVAPRRAPGKLAAASGQAAGETAGAVQRRRRRRR